ncbi:MAG: aldehyde dehydrogenase family protein [Trueperaceae bacterium]|nr:aldehyde dehydrogenase family protein [Trueperaceae bacterium]
MATVKEIFETMDYGPAPEANDIALAYIAQKKGSFDHFIAGKFVGPNAAGYFETINPATEQVLAKVAQGDEKDIDKAVKAAKKAFPEWSGLSGYERARYLYAIARHIQKHSRLLAVLETMDNGKPIRESRDIDIPLVARHFYHHAGWAQLRETEFPGYEPVGVCGQIIPWNFPLLMLAWKVAPALAAGNTVVLKPAEFTPLTALLFADICQEVGLPAGVVNIVTGDGSTGAALVAHPEVNKLAFTGSTEVGRLIREASAGSGKKLSLELGGKSPFIVFEDADLDAVVEGVVDAIWFNQGQVCCAGSRLLVQEGIAEKLHDKLRARMEKLRVGDPLDKAIDIGAIVAPVQLQKIQKLVEEGKAGGAKCWQPTWAMPQEGYFYPPTLLTEVEPASSLAQVEIFGPVIASMSFRTPAEAVELANNTVYGLAATVWSENINLALDIAPKLAAGVVWINSTNQFDAAAGFGGYRESGFGREGGREGMYEYLTPSWEKALKPTIPHAKKIVAAQLGESESAIEIDRTPKLYIGGKQARPDSGYSYAVKGAKGEYLGEVGLGNRKDIRNAVEAAHKAKAWTGASAHNRAQVLYYLAENLSARSLEFENRLVSLTGVSKKAASQELELSLERIFYYAALTDKYDGQIHATPGRQVTLAMKEAWGVMGISCPVEAPLLSFISLVIPAIAMGNRVVVSPSQLYPLIATDLYQVFDTSDVPGGVINIVTGQQDELSQVMAKHDDIAALWYVGSQAGSAEVEKASTGNLKATWVNFGKARDWFKAEQGQGEVYLRHACQIKNIWIPYGEGIR